MVCYPVQVWRYLCSNKEIINHINNGVNVHIDGFPSLLKAMETVKVLSYPCHLSYQEVKHIVCMFHLRCKCAYIYVTK